MIPTKGQWKKWTLPSKLTAIGTLFTFVGVLLSLMLWAFPYQTAQDQSSDLLDNADTIETMQRAWQVLQEARSKKDQEYGLCADLGQREAVTTLAKLGRLRNANLSNLCLSGIDLSDVDLSFVNFAKSRLEKADFSLSNLSYVNFDGAFLSHANFQHSLIAHTSFRDASLDQADFSGANILLADFRGAGLVGNWPDRKVVLGDNANQNICFDEYVDRNEITGMSRLDTKDHEWTCFEIEKPVKWDVIEEQSVTLHGTLWRRWRDGECSFHDERPYEVFRTECEGAEID